MFVFVKIVINEYHMLILPTPKSPKSLAYFLIHY